MTIFLPFGRLATRCIAPRSSQLLTRQIAPTSYSRVAGRHDDNATTKCRFQYIPSVRSFSSGTPTCYPATGTKPVGRPKAHTGRAPAKKRATKVTPKTTSTKKAAAGSKDGSKKAAKAPKAPRKPKAKTKTATPAKRARKAPSKSAIHKKEVAHRKELKETALYEEPKALPASAWSVFFSEARHKGQNLAETSAQTKELGVKYQNLAPEERERLNHTSNENKAQNDVNYKKWISQYTPVQIKEANAARKSIASAKPLTKNGHKHAIRLIKDDRLVKPMTSAFVFFTKDRWASGDFKGMTIKESGTLIGREWKELGNSEKQIYHGKATEDKNRYVEEYTSVYGSAPPVAKPKAPRKTKPTTAASS